MTITISLNREQLLIKLNAQREKAVAYDAEQQREFLALRKEEHRKFMELLKEALKWDTDTAHRRRFCAQLDYDDRQTTMSCPKLKTAEYDEVLTALSRDGRVKFRLDPSNKLHALLMWDPNPPAKTLCD